MAAGDITTIPIKDGGGTTRQVPFEEQADGSLAPVHYARGPEGGSIPVQLSGSTTAILDTTLAVRSTTVETDSTIVLSADDLDGFAAISLVFINPSVPHNQTLRMIGQFGDGGTFPSQSKFLDVSDAIDTTANAITIVSPIAEITSGGGSTAGGTAIKAPALGYLPKGVPIRFWFYPGGTAPTGGSCRVVVTGYPV